MFKTTELNKIKADTILKNFWKNNERFADLFNAALFEGEPVLKAEDLSEVDTDVSSLLKFNSHAETVQKILDVVKKTAYGVDFVIWGLESQQKIHYAMPLRHMVGDAFSYLKEYNEIAAKNRKDKNFSSSDEFLSNFKKTDRLHPMITICVYYGDSDWDGPLCLTDMLEIPDKVKPLVSDYKMNLVELKKSNTMKFHNSDVNMVFDLSRSIYERNYDKINRIYKDCMIPTEIGLVIGAITESQELINQALEIEKRMGGQMNMCTALEELKKEGIQEGIQEGLKTGIQEGEIKGTIKMSKKFNVSKDDTMKNIINEFSLTKDKAQEYIEKYW